MKKIFLGLSILLYLLPVCVNASTPSEQRRALINTANAYFDQGNQIQYDSYRKNLNSTPEDATSKHTVYTVCSGFKQGLLLPNLDGIDTVEKQVEIAMKKGKILPNDKYQLQRFEVIRHK